MGHYLIPALLLVATGYVYRSLYKAGQLRAGARQPGEVVVILGASSGIGRELALQYAQRGARLLLVARRQDRLRQLVQECTQCNPLSQVAYQVADLTSDTDLAQLSRALDTWLTDNDNDDKHTPIDTAILCAGVISVRPFVDLAYAADSLTTPTTSPTTSTATPKPSPWCLTPPTLIQARLPWVTARVRDLLNTNVTGLVAATTVVLPRLGLAPAGRLLVVSSAAGKSGTPTRGLYAASKHALHGFFDTLRMELAPTTRISVCLVCPSTVDTELRNTAVDNQSDPNRPSSSPPNISATAEPVPNRQTLEEPSARADSDSQTTGLMPTTGSHPVPGSKRGKLSPQACAARIIRAADNTVEREVYIPGYFAVVPWLQLICPAFVDRLARQKYGM
ncbi:hypothetical protein BJ085DRAFT_34102 [Dimargaris cristalligena]|uniref:NAD(P)-binding protein n=1 Tax=Dimargaris cristalligena TaxID=215637 RepID=A0A4Q0A3P4_9FUNG|nr:hypothetical protein BJ085DRAFT_34102 [Dimargaris cristalligena]|eukprot:RKP40032.1 hypothetical protein BJ085DRAFT_34102 [Dimargaris cristalligena]